MSLYLTGKLDPELNQVTLRLPNKKLVKEIILPNDFFNVPINVENTIVTIKNNVSGILEKKDFDELIDYIRKIYVIQNDNISKDIKELLNNPIFKTYINEYINNNISNILNNDSIHSFEEISFFVFLLGFGKYNNILIDLNTYDFAELSELFDLYISNINLNLGNEILLNICFNSFILLTELINKLSILDQVDSYRKCLIDKLNFTSEKKIIKLKEQLNSKNYLSLEKLNILNYSLGKISINSAHINYIEIKNRNLNDILNDFLNIVEKQSNGFQISLLSNFGNNLNNEKITKEAFIGNMAYIISIMITKLQNFNNNDILKNDILKNDIFLKIVKIFLDSSDIKDIIGVNSLSELNNLCNDIYVQIYKDNHIPPLKDNVINIKTGKDVIKDFISNPDKINDFQIESIHHLVMFLPELTLEENLELGGFLIKTEKFNNYNFEFLKLKTLDMIIGKIDDGYIDENIEIFMTNFIIYIENNKIASQLLNTYSRLYLSIAFYYSKIYEEEIQEKAMEYFTIFIKMGGEKFNFEKYGKKLNDLYYNLGLYNLNSNLCNCKYKGSLCDVSFEGCNYTQEQVINYGITRLNNYKKKFDIKIKNDLDRILSDLLESALNKNGIDDDEINDKVSIVLSNKIFYGIAETIIININNDNEFIKEIVLHNGINTFQIDLFNGYKLLFIYPKIYEEIFKQIFDDENYYIVRNIKNIITSYLKRKDLYLDHNTGLPNEMKLKMILSEIEGPISFICIKLNTLKSINNGYSYELGDEYIKNISESLMAIEGLKGNVYRLSGAKIGIIIGNSDEKELNLLIKKIKDIKFILGLFEHKIDALMGIVLNDDNRVVEKSNSALSYAKSTSDGIFYYKEEINDSEKNKGLLDYLNKLDLAIEEDRIHAFFQPIFDAKTKKIVKYEALMRLKTESGDFEGPYKYLMSAEKFGRLILIFNIISRKVFEFASENPGNFSINLSGDDLKNNKLLTYIKELSLEYKIDNSRITFEILEGEWIEGGNQNLNIIQELKDLGFKIAMDDFGANSSNINRLLDLLKNKQVDYLKIDGKIIKALVDNDILLSNISRKLLEGIVEAAHIAGVKIIAEFVENEKIVMICEFLGIDYLQGYHLGKPGQYI